MGSTVHFQRGRRRRGERSWGPGGGAIAPMETLVLTAAEHGIPPFGLRPVRRPATRLSAVSIAQCLTAEYFSPNTSLSDGGASREEAALARLQELARALIREPARGEAVLSKTPDRSTPSSTAAPALPVPTAPAEPQRPAAMRRGGWRDVSAPSQTDLEELAAEAFAALPEQFRNRCEGVAILVRDYPEQEVLDSLGLENEFDLLGLYEGVDLAQEDTGRVATDVSRIFLYRRPLLDYWCEHEETLGALITHVLVHEIGHHFGLSDAQMEAIEAAAG